MLNKLRARLLSLKFRAIRRAVIILIAKIPKDLERAIIFGDALNHFLMISPFRLIFKFSIPEKVTLTPNINLNKKIIICANIFPQNNEALLGRSNVGIAKTKTNIKVR